MENCLITKLKGECDNASLKFYGDFVLYGNPSSEGGRDIRVESEIPIQVKCLSGEAYNQGTAVVFITAGQTKTAQSFAVKIKQGVRTELECSDKYSVTWLSFSLMDVNNIIGDICYMTKLERIQMGYSNTSKGAINLEVIAEAQFPTRKSGTLQIDLSSNFSGTFKVNGTAITKTITKIVFGESYVQIKQGDTVLGTYDGTNWDYPQSA